MIGSLSRKPLMWALSLLLAGGLLAGSAAYAQDNTLRIAMPTEPPTIDPHIAVGGAYEITQAIFEQLVKLDHDLNPVPTLAKTWEQLDDTTWRLGLVEGVSFHSGNPFNAEALKAWFDAMLDPNDPSVNAAWIRHIKGVKVIGEYTLDVHLKEPFGPFVRGLSVPHLVVYDAVERKRLGDRFGEKPSGTGPFRYKEWVRGQALTLEANPDYRQEGKPKVDAVVIRFIPEPSGRIAALETGQVDLAYALPGHQIPRMQAMADVTPLTVPALRPILWYYNMKNEFLQDPAVRRALIVAVDMELIGDTILEHGGRVLKGYISPGAFGGLDLTFEYDPEYAHRLLAHSGWEKNSDGIYEKGGKTLTLTAMIGFDRYPDIVAVGEAIQAQLRDFGVDFHINSIEQTALEAAYRAGRNLPPDTDQIPEFDMTTLGAGIRDAQAFRALSDMFSKAGFQHSTGHWDNPQFDLLSDIAVSPATERVQLKAYHDAQRIMYAEVPGFPLYSPFWVNATRTSVSGYAPHPTEAEFWENIEIKQ